MRHDAPSPLTVAENCLEAAWDTPDANARATLDQARGVILTLLRRLRCLGQVSLEQRLRLEERCVTLARTLERIEAELEGYKSRDPGASL